VISEARFFLRVFAGNPRLSCRAEIDMRRQGDRVGVMELT
jgi:hypothetical protein